MVITQLKEKSKAVSLTQLATFVDTLPQIENDLQRMKEITSGLRVNASQLSDGMKITYNRFIFVPIFVGTMKITRGKTMACLCCK